MAAVVVVEGMAVEEVATAVEGDMVAAVVEALGEEGAICPVHKASPHLAWVPHRVSEGKG